MNEENLKPFKPGPDPRRNLKGRPQSVYNVMNASGYSKDDISRCFGELGWQTEDELEAIFNDKSSPTLPRVTAQAFLKAMRKGDFRYISEILQHVIGKPKEQTENKHVHKIVVEYVNPNSKPVPPPSGAAGDYTEFQEV